MHHRGVLHRDIQLGNCVIGLPPNEKTIYMIDFGFSKRYLDQYTGRHIPDSKLKRDFIGNYWFRYASPSLSLPRLNAPPARSMCTAAEKVCFGPLHASDANRMPVVPSRRDDLEAAALMFIHLLTPRGLSWTRNGVPKTDDAHARLKAEKRKATPEALCRGLPIEFEEFLMYTRRLAFKENPDYDQWTNRFHDLAAEEGFANIDQFIWPPPVPAAPSIRTINTPLRARTPAMPRDAMADILNGLTNLDLGAKPVLGDRTNVQEAVRKAREDAKLDSAPPPAACETIVISSDSEGSARVPIPRFQRSKAFQLNQLADRVANAMDNATLARLVREFATALQVNSSRTLTREAFGVLDVLYKQLDDPSVFVKPTRCVLFLSSRVQSDFD